MLFDSVYQVRVCAAKLYCNNLKSYKVCVMIYQGDTRYGLQVRQNADNVAALSRAASNPNADVDIDFA